MFQRSGVIVTPDLGQVQLPCDPFGGCFFPSSLFLTGKGSQGFQNCVALY